MQLRSHAWRTLILFAFLEAGAVAQGLAGRIEASTHIGVFELGDQVVSEDDTQGFTLTTVNLISGDDDFGEDAVALWQPSHGCSGLAGPGPLESEQTLVFFLRRNTAVDPCDLSLDEGTDLLDVLWTLPASLASDVGAYVAILEEDPEDRFHDLVVLASSGAPELQLDAACDLLAGSLGVTVDAGDVEALQELVAGLETTDARLIPLALTAARVGAVAAALERSLALVTDANQDLDKATAVDLVGQLGSESDAENLSAALEPGADVDRAAIIMALGALRSEAGREALEKTIGCPDRDLRILGLFALGEIGSSESIWQATLFAQSADPSVATAALYCLGRLGEVDEQAAEIISELAVDWPEQTIRERAGHARGNPGWMQVIFTW